MAKRKLAQNLGSNNRGATLLESVLLMAICAVVVIGVTQTGRSSANTMSKVTVALGGGTEGSISQPTGAIAPTTVTARQ